MGLPFVLAKTNFRGRVFMTHPTKAIYKWLIQDSVRVQYVRALFAPQKAEIYTQLGTLLRRPKDKPSSTPKPITSLHFPKSKL